MTVISGRDKKDAKLASNMFDSIMEQLEEWNDMSNGDELSKPKETDEI